MSLGFGLGLKYSKLSGGGNTDAFIIEVKTDNAGTSNDNQFQFTGAVGDYNVVAKQNGIVVQTFSDLSDAATITFANGAETYILELTPKEVNPFTQIQFGNGGDKDKILDVKQWGNIVWDSFENAFYGCNNMKVTATDVPNLSSVTSMNSMFQDASSANPDTSNWDVSNVTDMSAMFRNATSANPDTSNWDVSNVTSMNSMFRNASSANPDTSNWDVSNVTDMERLFQDSTSANPDTSNWDVSNVTSMSFMFRSASSANPDTSNWDVSNVTDMSFMFLDSNLSEENLTACYENWSQLNLQQNVEFSAGNTKYNASGQAGRDILVNTYNWIIEDGGQV
jgi:surface protein